MTNDELNTLRDVLIGVSLSTVVGTRSDPGNVTTALKLFAQSHVSTPDAKRILVEISEGVAMFADKLKRVPSKLT